ncbi:unnamed protein product [Moneuplotes crassus]|uniref:Myb-like domain-containing protein n=1 Tax=Euplotes crassus TaxID=5936 RepID=A0AAD1TYZ4_EUPCR|nr:unnamed protein product [Moneuplotes crassus]
MKFTPEEDKLLVELKQKYPDVPMIKLSKYFKDRNAKSLYYRWDKLNSTYVQGQWDDSEKTQLFEKVFDIASTNVELILKSLDVKRKKRDVQKQISKIKEIASKVYLGIDCQFNEDTCKLERKREFKAQAKSQNKRIKVEDTYDAIDTIQNIHKTSKKGLVKEEFKHEADNLLSNSLDETRANAFKTLPEGLSRDDFLKHIDSLPSGEGTEWTTQEDQNLLQLYQELGSNWTRISVFTDDRSAERSKQRFCSLLLWGAYNFQQKIKIETPLKSHSKSISTCLKMLLKELTGRQKEKGLTSKIKLESGANISESDYSDNSEFCY